MVKFYCGKCLDERRAMEKRKREKIPKKCYKNGKNMVGTFLQLVMRYSSVHEDIL